MGFAVARVGKHVLGLRDDLGEDFDLLLQARASAKEYVDSFLEIEQPERQLEVLRVQNLRPITEGVAVFVVRVDEEDPQVRPHLQNLAQDDGNPARFTDARAAEEGEMLAQHVVDLDASTDGAVLLELPDIDRVRAGRVVDPSQIVASKQIDLVSYDRIIGNAALKSNGTTLSLLELAEQVDAGGQWDASLTCRLLSSVDVGDHADHRGSQRAHCQEFADGDAPLIGQLGPDGCRQPNVCLRAAHGENVSDQLKRIDRRTGHVATP